MNLRPNGRDVLWMGVGAAILLSFTVLVLVFGREPAPDPQLALKTQRLELVAQMQLGLASASEAERSAVLAITDQESQAFADQARATAQGVERERRELGELLQKDGSQDEKKLFAEFSERFVEFQRIDAELLEMAVKNTNLKAYALAFGPAQAALDAMSAALSRVVAANADAADANTVTSLALGAEIAALHIQTLLPPHIAEATDPRMDELEAQMKTNDGQVRSDLEGLGAIPKLGGAADLAEAKSRYAQFQELRGQILVLSRENTNVRSLSISLNQKRKVMLDCHDVLGKLHDAIGKEPLAGGRFPVR